ncbi:MAG: NADH-quinone oxidoreductase subunit H [bacterium]|jgi:formate hydrogenlyase subunit 4|nr:NADH-quinone oxidoreductase subunit H [bacterium]
MILALFSILAALLFAPFLFGVINRTKALFAGRTGQPLLQMYYDLYKLGNKGVVYSHTISWVFRVYPVLALAGMLLVLLLLPQGGHVALLAGPGDLFALAYILALVRFFNVIAALDTGSSFEGMGASREVQFSALAEIAFLLGLCTLACVTGSYSLSGIYTQLSYSAWLAHGAVFLLIAIAFFIVFLAENARIPVDDPNTHLELTMIHEVMILDSSGPDLAFLHYASALKFWILGSLLIGLLFPIHTGYGLIDVAFAWLGLLVLAVSVGIVESIMARLRLLRVPQLLVSASVFSFVALIFLLR